MAKKIRLMPITQVTALPYIVNDKPLKKFLKEKDLAPEDISLYTMTGFGKLKTEHKGGPVKVYDMTPALRRYLKSIGIRTRPKPTFLVHEGEPTQEALRKAAKYKVSKEGTFVNLLYTLLGGSSIVGVIKGNIELFKSHKLAKAATSKLGPEGVVPRTPPTVISEYNNLMEQALHHENVGYGFIFFSALSALGLIGIMRTRSSMMRAKDHIPSFFLSGHEYTKEGHGDHMNVFNQLVFYGVSPNKIRDLSTLRGARQLLSTVKANLRKRAPKSAKKLRAFADKDKHATLESAAKSSPEDISMFANRVAVLHDLFGENTAKRFVNEYLSRSEKKRGATLVRASFVAKTTTNLIKEATAAGVKPDVAKKHITNSVKPQLFKDMAHPELHYKMMMSPKKLLA